MAVERFIPSIGKPNWDIKELTKEERIKLKERLVISLVTSEKEYQTVIGYLYKKYPQEMDGIKYNGKENVAIQWNYKPNRNKLMILNNMTAEKHDMYAFIVYDKERDMEPVAFAGSYFKLVKPIDELKDVLNKKYLCKTNGELDKNGTFQRCGFGYVMFISPEYRRLGLATDLWWAEAQLYREALNIRVQMEIQNSYSIESTRKMFSNPEKCIITSKGRLKNDGTYSQIRCLLNYEDEDVIKGFENMLPNLKTIYNKPNWNFLEREGFTIEKLIKPWNK